MKYATQRTFNLGWFNLQQAMFRGRVLHCLHLHYYRAIFASNPHFYHHKTMLDNSAEPVTEAVTGYSAEPVTEVGKALAVYKLVNYPT